MGHIEGLIVMNSNSVEIITTIPAIYSHDERIEYFMELAPSYIKSPAIGFIRASISTLYRFGNSDVVRVIYYVK